MRPRSARGGGFDGGRRSGIIPGTSSSSTSSFRVILSAGLLLAASSGVCQAQQQQQQKSCYFPNGQQATGDFPCDPAATTTSNSACCGGSVGSVCLSNKLCRGPDGNVVRGSCTDAGWTSGECASYCLGANTGGTDLISCSNVTNTDTSYCCDHTTSCCDTGVGRFDVLPSNPRVWAVWDADASEFVVQAAATTGLATSISSSAGTTTRAPAAAVTTPSGNGTNTTETTTTAEEEETSSSLSTTGKVGIGVAGAIMIALIAAVVYLLRRHKKMKKALAEAAAGNNNQDEEEGKQQRECQEQAGRALDGGSDNNDSPVVEADSGWPGGGYSSKAVELESDEKPLPRQELESNHAPVELPAN